MHLDENYAAMVLSPLVTLRRDIDEVRIMRKYNGAQGTGVRELSLVAYASFTLVIDRNCPPLFPEARGHSYFRRLPSIIFSAHLTTFWATATACRYSLLVTGSAGPG